MLKAIDFDKMKRDICDAVCEVLKASMPMMSDDMVEEMLMPWVASFTNEYVVIELGMDYWQVPYTYDDAGMVTLSPQADWLKVEPQQNWVEAAAKARKPAGWVKVGQKAWELNVLGAPYYGPYNGKDSYGDWFDSQTDFWLDKIGSRPVVHYHGWDSEGVPVDPEVIGKEIGYEVKSDGVWFKVLLDEASKTAAEIWEAAKKGFARASSGAISHLVRPIDEHGHIDLWPIGEISLMDISKGNYPANSYAVALPVLKAAYKAANLNLQLPDDQAGAETPKVESLPGQGQITTQQESGIMDEKQIEAYLQKREAEKAEAARIAALEADKVAYEALKAQIAAAPGTQQINRLPNPSQEPRPQQITVTSKYDAFTVGQLGLGMEMLKAVGKSPSMEMFRAFHAKALKTVEAPDYYSKNVLRDEKGNILREFSALEHEAAARAVKAINPMQFDAAVKSDEIMYSTQASYGNDWVPAMWSPELWDLVRNGADVLSRFRQVEVPGESLTIPTLAGKTVLYKTAQTTNQAQLSETAPAATLTKATTGSVTLTPVKGTAWLEWSGELSEDSITPVLPSLQSAMALDIMEQIDEILISGDTDTTIANISDYGNGAISTAWRLLIANGLRDHALANSNKVDIGAMDATKFLAVKRKLGTNGVNSINMQKCFWVFDPAFYDTALALGETLTAEKRSSNVGTFEDGLLTRVYGAPIVVSDRYGKTDSSGYINNSAGSNTKGSFILVRTDRWIVGFGRRVTLEALPRDRAAIISDTQGLFASFRLDFAAQGTGAASLGYDVTLIG